MRINRSNLNDPYQDYEKKERFSYGVCRTYSELIRQSIVIMAGIKVSNLYFNLSLIELKGLRLVS